MEIITSLVAVVVLLFNSRDQRFGWEQAKFPADQNSMESLAILKPLIPAPKTGGRPRTVNMREIINAIFYFLLSGCAWRLMPHDLPPWSEQKKFVESLFGIAV